MMNLIFLSALLASSHARFDPKASAEQVVGFSEHRHSPEENLIVVRKYYECLFKKGDFATLSTLIAPAANYYQAEGLPYGGIFTGFENWTKMFTQVSALLDLEVTDEPVYFVDNLSGDVIMRFTIRCKAKKSGKTISMPIAEQFALKDGKIISVRPFYFDTLTFTNFLK